ncbi:sterol desaturase family protein [Neptuniibacter sp. CAU 1671]|nr:sterol desaturase family protein [Neptuniibacter sp. CAU 1671]
MFSAFLLGIGWLCWQQKLSLSGAFKALFSSDIWWSVSAKADYKVFFINRVLMLFLAPWLLSKMALSGWLFYSLHDLMGGRPSIGQDLPAGLIMLSFTLVYFLLDDASRYALHRCLHTIPCLWAFHKVHHSATSLTPITVFRIHPVELVLFSLRSTVVQAICITFFVFFFGEKADLVTVFGTSFILFWFNLAGSNLRHSHVPVRYGVRLERWLISPAQHQLHHSTDPKHFDCNFGVVLAVWDRIGRSLVVSQRRQALTFGISRQHAAATRHTLSELYWIPVVESLQVLKKGAQKYLSKLIGVAKTIYQ